MKQENYHVYHTCSLTRHHRQANLWLKEDPGQTNNWTVQIGCHANALVEFLIAIYFSHPPVFSYKSCRESCYWIIAKNIWILLSIKKKWDIKFVVDRSARRICSHHSRDLIFTKPSKGCRSAIRQLSSGIVSTRPNSKFWTLNERSMTGVCIPR